MSPSRKTAPVFAPPTRRRFSPLVAIWRSPCCTALACPRFPPPDVPFPLIPSRLWPFSVPPQASNNSQALGRVAYPPLRIKIEKGEKEGLRGARPGCLPFSHVFFPALEKD